MTDKAPMHPYAIDHSQLFQTEEGLSLLADIADFGIWEIDLTTNELRWDETMHRIYGVSPEDFTGRYEDWANTLDEETRARSEAAFRALLEEGKHFDVELDIRRPSDGERRVLRGLARLFKDEAGNPSRVLGINEDITDRVMAARRLEAEESKFRSLFEISPVGFAMNDYETGEFLAFNEALYAPTGYSAEEFFGVSYWDLTPERYMAEEEQMLQQMAQTGRYGPFEKEYIRKDGSTYPVLLYGAKTRTAEGREVIWSVIQDISALKQAQLEAERASAARGQFLANMSHEIRTPLNAVIGIADILGRTPLNREQSDYLDKIRGASRLLLGVINDILDLSKIDAGELQLESRPFSLAATVSRLDALFRDAANDKRLALHMPSELERLPMLLGDELRLSQVLANLLSNAIKFTDTGSVTLNVERMRETGGDIELLFSVIDTGVGIGDEWKEALFQPFQQADTSTTRTHGGTGLGLTISQHLINKMGGEIWAESRTTGSVFSFKLRLPVADRIESTERRPSERTVAPPALSGRTILVVEDNPLNQLVTRKFLEETGALTLLAENGRDALTAAADKAVDLVLMDLQMPIMDGFEAARQLRQRDPALPIIALSAAVLDDERDKAKAAGMNDHLSKPLVRESLYDLLQQYLIDSPGLDPCGAADDGPSVAPVLPNSLPGVDLVAGREALEDDEFYRTLLEMFLEQLNDDYAPLFSSRPAALEETDFRSRLHTLKGGAGTIAATRVAGAAAALEAALRQGESIEAAAAEFRDALDELRDGLTAFFHSG